jgi:PIN domain nuclease of toxin-antitoxin system
LLLDTCAFLWMLTDDRKLGPKARAIMAGSEARSVVSIVSLWEVALKSAQRRLPTTPQEAAAAIAASGLALLDLDQRHVFVLMSLPQVADHRDPFDRMLVAQAKAEGLTLMTADPKLARYGIPVLGCG